MDIEQELKAVRCCDIHPDAFPPALPYSALRHAEHCDGCLDKIIIRIAEIEEEVNS